MSGTGSELNVAVLLYPGCVLAEVVEAATRLRNEGAEVHWVSPDGSPVLDQSGLAMSPGSDIDGLSAIQLDGLVVAGGDPAAVMGDNAVRSLVRRCATDGIVAGICAGVLVLADAGVLDGSTATHNYRAPWAPPEVATFVAELFANVTVEPDPSIGVVIDGSVITALPNAAAEFSIATCRSLGVYDDEQASQLTRHLQGDFVPALFERLVDVSLQPAPIVRRAQPVDIDQLAALQVQLFAEDAGVHEPFVDLTWSQREGHDDFAELLASDESVVLVAEADRRMVGFLAGYLSPPSPTHKRVTFAHLRSLYVLDGYRRSGAGATLTEAFLDWANACDAVEAYVSVYAQNHRAQRLYQRHGFIARSTTRVKPLGESPLQN